MGKTIKVYFPVWLLTRIAREPKFGSRVTKCIVSDEPLENRVKGARGLTFLMKDCLFTRRIIEMKKTKVTEFQAWVASVPKGK